MRAASVEDKDFFKSELVLSENVMEFAEAILTVDPTILDTLKARRINNNCQRMRAQILEHVVGIRRQDSRVCQSQTYIRKARFAESSKRSASSGSKGCGRVEETLKSTPPTGTIQDLITMQAAMALKAEAHNIEQKADWPDIRKSVLMKIAPIKDLIKETKDRVKAIDNRKQNRPKAVKAGSAPTVPNLDVSYLSDAC